MGREAADGFALLRSLPVFSKASPFGGGHHATITAEAAQRRLVVLPGVGQWQPSVRQVT